jgi:hypothetical protein
MGQGENSGNPYGYTDQYLAATQGNGSGGKTNRPKPGSTRPVVHKATHTTSVSRPTHTSSGGGGGGNSPTGGGGSVGFNALGTAAPIINPNAYLTDPTYEAQQAALQKALADYTAQMGDTQTRYSTNYAAQTHDLGVMKDQGVDANNNDYASRGLYESGLQAQASGDLLTQFARRQADMDRAKSDYFAGLQRDFGNFKTDQQLQMDKAKQDAIARQAAGIVL